MIGQVLLAFCLGGLLGALLMATASVSSRNSMCELCLNEAQKPAKALKIVKETKSIPNPNVADKDAIYYDELYEEFPIHQPIRKKDRKPYFKKHNK